MSSQGKGLSVLPMNSLGLVCPCESQLLVRIHGCKVGTPNPLGAWGSDLGSARQGPSAD